MSAFLPGERYHHGDGLLYRIDARVKIVIVVLFAFAATAIPEGRWPAFAAFGLFVVAADVASGLPPLLVVRRSLLAVPFVLGLSHREVERDLVVDVAGAAAGTQQRPQPMPPTDRVIHQDALHDDPITRAASRASPRTRRDPSTPLPRRAHACPAR